MATRIEWGAALALAVMVVAVGAYAEAPTSHGLSLTPEAPACPECANETAADRPPVELMATLAADDLVRRLWRPAAPLWITRWRGLDTGRQVVIIQAKPDPDESWVVERIEALHTRPGARPALQVVRGRLSPKDGQRLRDLLSDPLMAAPWPHPPDLCLDGQEVVIRANTDGHPRLIVQECGLNPIAAEMEELVCHVFPPLKFSYGRNRPRC